VAYAQIDWHDFVVVETVDFQYGEIGNFPPPTTPDQVGVRTLMQERVDNGEETVEMSDAEDDMQVDSDDEIEKRVNGRMYAPESELRVPGEEKSSRDNNQVIIFKIYVCIKTILILFNLNKKRFKIWMSRLVMMIVIYHQVFQDLIVVQTKWFNQLFLKKLL
jgi:hypothetical protein